jgi:Calcineurin-like phosphoesterase
MKSIRVLTVTDLHQVADLYTSLEQAVAEHQPDVLALVGDFLHGGLLTPGHYSVPECASLLAALPSEVVFVRGNHEGDNWEGFADRWLQTGRTLHIPHEDAVVFGPLVIVGFPCSYAGERYFLMGRPSRIFHPEVWLPKIRQQHGAAIGSLWLMHEHPAGTALCPRAGFMAGLDEWRKAIEDYQPWVIVSGHDHQTPLVNGNWWDRIGRTTCINVGQSDGKSRQPSKLHYCVLDFEFPTEESSLPQKVTISAHPWGETLTLPSAPCA